jgi:hypothetical protein
VKAARPSGTLAKPRNLKPGAIAARKAKAAVPANAKGKAGAARSAGRTQKQRIAQYERVAAKLGKQINKTESNLSTSPGSQFSREREISRRQRLSVLRNRERRAGKWLNSMLASKPAPTPRKPSPKGAGPRMKAARPAGTVVKPRGLKVGAIAGRKGAGRQGQRQRAEARAIANYNRSIKAQPETKTQAGRAAIGQVTATRAVEFLRGVKRIGPQRGMTSHVLPKGFVPQSRPGVPAPSAQPQPDRKPSSGSQKPKRKTAAQKPTRSPSRLPQETRSALRDIAGRRVQAEQALTGQIQKLGGITKQQAQAVFSYYSKRKFIKSQGIDGVGVRSGNLLDRDTIRQALQLAQEPAQPRKPRRNR